MRAPGRWPAPAPFKTVLLSVALGIAAIASAASATEEPAVTPTVASAAKGSLVNPPARTAGTLTTAPAVPSDGTSLGEIVRKSKEEREGAEPRKKKSLGTITNETLKKDGGAPTAPPSSKKASGTLNVLPKGSMPAPAAPAPTVARDAKGRSEQDWRGFMARNRSEIEKAEADVKRLDLETKRLENDFYAWSDGNYRERVIRPNWDQAREDLRKARVALDAAQASRSELEEDARKSGTPPGWLRDQ
jgi:hypothetical protein